MKSTYKQIAIYILLFHLERKKSHPLTHHSLCFRCRSVAALMACIGIFGAITTIKSPVASLTKDTFTIDHCCRLSSRPCRRLIEGPRALARLRLCRDSRSFRLPSPEILSDVSTLRRECREVREPPLHVLLLWPKIAASFVAKLKSRTMAVTRAQRLPM